MLPIVNKTTNFIKTVVYKKFYMQLYRSCRGTPVEELDCRLPLLDQATKANIFIFIFIPRCNLEFNVYTVRLFILFFASLKLRKRPEYTGCSFIDWIFKKKIGNSKKATFFLGYNQFLNSIFCKLKLAVFIV